MRDSNSTKAGLGLCEVLLVVFIILKLLGIITWNWVWVLAPFWIPFVIVIILAIIVIIQAILISTEA